LEVSRLQAEIDSFRRDTQLRYRNTSNPLPPPPEPLPLERFPAFARPGAGDAADPLLAAVPYPAPPPRTKPTTTTNGHRTDTSHAGTAHIQYVPTTHITQPPIAPRPRHAEAPRLDERSRRPTAQEDSGVDRHHERTPHAKSSSNTRYPDSAADTRYTDNEGRSHFIPSAASSQRVVRYAPSPTPSWADNPLVEERRSDEEREIREVRRGVRMVANGGSDMGSRPGVEGRLVSAAAYVQGYGSGYDSGFRIASEPATFAPSSFGSDRSERARGFPVLESPDRAIGGLGLMGVPQPISVGTVSTPDEDATPMNPARRLSRRNTSQVVETDRSTRRLGDRAPIDIPPNGASRRAPMQTITQVLGIRHAASEGPLHNGVNGTDSSASRRRNGMAEPIDAEDDSPRSETTWGTVHSLSSNNNIGEGSMSSLGMLLGLHTGGARGQGSVAGDSYIGRGDLGDNITSEREEDDGMETPVMPGSLPGTASDASVLGLIREDEDYSRNSSATARPRHRTTSYAERIPQPSATAQDSQARRARRNERTNEHHHYASPTTHAEALHADNHRGANASDITNALSLHFDATSSAHDYQGHTFSAPPPYPNTGSGPEILAPTPIVGGPNVIHLWANRT
jgi:hypothetical protein